MESESPALTGIEGESETVYLRWGLELMWLVLKPSQNPQYLVSGLNEAQVLFFFLKLRFLMSHGRKNSVRDKVIGKKWIYLERNTLPRQCGPLQRVSLAVLKFGVVSYYGMGDFIG